MNKEINEYVRQELKKAEQALKAAQNLLVDGLYDDAVSRAYYAVFHSARAALKIKGIETVSHRGLIIEVSEGDRIGQVVKLSNKGFIWRTWEGTLGVTQSGAYVDSWDFSVDPNNLAREALLSKLRQAYTTGVLVRIHYSQKLLPLYWRGKTSYFVEDVKFARELD